MTDASVDLRALAREREARRPAQAASAPIPSSWKPTPAQASTQPSQTLASMHSMHRSIKLARSLGLALAALAVLFLLLGFFSRMTVGVLVLGAIGLARGGASLVHSLCPEMLYEGSKRPPSDDEVARAASVGLYSLGGLKTFGASLTAEYALALDSLAWCCTYGKKNCLTDQMFGRSSNVYSEGLGKIIGLVWGKLREGIIRC